MILHRLKHETSIYHAELEQELALLHSDITHATYCQILQRFWGFYAPIELQLGVIITQYYPAFDFEQRRKCALLELDLQALGGKNSSLPLCKNLPTLHTMAQVIGCLYVMEGATLGGQVIARHLQEVLALSPQNGCAFFSSYGCHVGSMWQSFIRFIIVFSSKNNIENAIVLSACETFHKLKNWLLEDEAQ